MDSMHVQTDSENALKEFLLDIDCLDALDEWANTLNIFDVLKISRAEIRHSNMLAWLLNPNENHGLGDRVIRGFLQYYAECRPEEADIFTALLMNCGGFSIYREWHHIDILAVSEEPGHETVLCIENKIDAGEGRGQLNRYRTVVQEAFPRHRKLFLFLTPDARDASDTDNWCQMGYEHVLDILEGALRKVKLQQEAQLLIDNYIQIIRRDILEDRRLEELCADIYARHRKALDLLFDHRPDRISELSELARKWGREKTQEGVLELAE
ncbi:MAG: PD-(D/E)XK nuclease family protein, partial [Eggerthellaceae bacterium]|nr:PD-(D/E)XK nuclease family protein [Eggerthellaceae bacterium]